MDMTRRHTLLAGVGLLLTGCSAATSRYDRPAPWTARSYTEHRRPTPTGATAAAPGPAASNASASGLNVVARQQWTGADAIRSKVNPMRGIDRITVHHEGWKPVYFSDRRSTAERIELIRTVHTRDRGWGDIGYHYVIDRSGAVWEGRPLAYQGAHVRDNNEHNLGILVLGNFDKQRPSEAQLQGLIKTLRACQHEHRVGTRRVYTHQEIVSTACPGRNLQNQMGGVRRYLA